MNSHDISAITCQASVPSHLEDQLSRLEAVADEFRARTLRYLDHLGSSWINLMKIDETAIRHERFFWVMVNSPEDHFGFAGEQSVSVCFSGKICAPQIICPAVPGDGLWGQVE